MDVESPLSDQFYSPLFNHNKVSRRYEDLDRFIPNRSAMDFDYAHYMLSGGKVKKQNSGVHSASSEAYMTVLAQVFNMSRTRILAFRNNSPNRVYESASPIKQSKRRRCIPQSPATTLDAPYIINDFYLNLLDWGCNNIIAIALANSVYLWDASNGSTNKLLEVSNDFGPVTSVSWAPDGIHLAVGLNNSHVQLWDSLASRLLRTLQGHRSRVGSLDWNGPILTTGGMDSKIMNTDLRIRSHVVGTYRGHSDEICGLKWSASGGQLASGGNDNLLHIWSLSQMSSPSSSRRQWLHRMTDHNAAARALSWCPFQSYMVASGGGTGDRCIKFWNTDTGACLNSVDTGSQVCSLLWNRHERELLSSHGFTENQLTLWRYPAMLKLAELRGHRARVLHMAQSPDGYTVATAAADETLNIWNTFGNPELKKRAAKRKLEPFFDLVQIR